MPAFYTHYLAEHKDCKVIIEGRTPQFVSPETAMLEEGCLTMERAATDLFEPVFSAGVAVTLESRANYQFAPIMTAPDRSYRLRVEKGGVEVFRGWVTNELYEEEYDQPPYPVTLHATDGLASLEDYRLDVESLPAANPEYPELVTLAELVEGCLSCTGLELPVVYCSSLRAESGGDGRGMLAALAVDRNALFNDEDGVRKAEPALDTLTNILKSFGMRAYQDSGRWVIERYTDRAKSPESVLTLDTADYPFVETPTLSISAGYGSQVINLNVDTFDSVFHTDPKVPLAEADDLYMSMPPFRWHRVKSNNPIVAATEKGYSIMSPENSRAVTVFCCAPFRIKKGDKVGVSLKIKAEGRPESNNINFYADSKRQCYIPVEVYLTKGAVTVAESNAFDLKPLPLNGFVPLISPPVGGLAPFEPASGDFVFAPPLGYKPGTYEWDYRKELYKDTPWVYKHPVIALKDLFIKGANLSFTVGESAEFAEQMTKADGIVIVIRSRVRSFEPGDNPRPAATEVERVYNWRIGSIKVAIDSSSEEPVDTLTGALDGGYLREAPELDLPLRMDCDPLPIDYTYRGALFDPATGKLASGIYANGVRQPLEQCLLADNFAQYARRRDRFTATLQRNEVLSPASVYHIATRPGHGYLLTGCTTDLIEGEHEITLEEINPEEITPAWQG